MKKRIGILAGLLTLSIAVSGCSASTQRAIKDLKSEHNGGLHRTLDVVSGSGQRIAHYEGKFDIEYTKGKIKFIDQNDKAHIIYLGADATVITDEE